MKEKLNCPFCKAENEYDIKEYVNLKEHPAAKAAILSDEIMRCKCPDCERDFYLMSDLRYVDPDEKLVIDYIEAGEHPENLEEAIKAAGVELEREFPDYSIRIVKSINDMKEKILIHDARLDDRVIEILKMFAFTHLVTSNPSTPVKTILFNINDDGKKDFLLLSEKGEEGRAKFVEEIYEKIMEAYELSVGDGHVIDREWAAGELKKAL